MIKLKHWLSLTLFPPHILLLTVLCSRYLRQLDSRKAIFTFFENFGVAAKRQTLSLLCFYEKSGKKNQYLQSLKTMSETPLPIPGQAGISVPSDEVHSQVMERAEQEKKPKSQLMYYLQWYRCCISLLYRKQSWVWKRSCQFIGRSPFCPHLWSKRMRSLIQAAETIFLWRLVGLSLRDGAVSSVA